MKKILENIILVIVIIAGILLIISISIELVASAGTYTIQEWSITDISGSDESGGTYNLTYAIINQPTDMNTSGTYITILGIIFPAFPTIEGGIGGGGYICIPEWLCSGWSFCLDGTQTRRCVDLNECNDNYTRPIEFRECVFWDSIKERWLDIQMWYSGIFGSIFAGFGDWIKSGDWYKGLINILNSIKDWIVHQFDIIFNWLYDKCGNVCSYDFVPVTNTWRDLILWFESVLHP